ncbi:MAG TPA: potassium transporter TrkG [Bacteroidales bacterium]|nr:potassium transporter TrkG [Bacteroidales bacterium]
MINFRIIARIFSLLIIAEGFFMLVSAAVSYIYQEPATSSFLYSALITLLTGIIAFTPARNAEKITGKKEGYLIITGGWVIFTLFGTLPYLLSGTISDFTDAFFESISGFTTTGATIFRDVEILPHGILFWRSLTQWIGGMGVIFISLYVLPVFKTIFIQLPAGDFSGQQAEKIHPRIKDVAKRLIIIYAILTLSEALMLALSGVPVFDSVCLSFSTMSTGGFSTANNGITAFALPFTTIILTLYMFIAGMSMTYIYHGLKRDFRKITGSNEIIFYSAVCLTFMVIVSGILYFMNGVPAGKSIIQGSFHVISIVTTTGFYVHDNQLWNHLLMIIFFALMLTGGTSGSPSGGFKSMRLLIVIKNSRSELSRLLHPYAFIPVKLDKKILNQTIVFNVLVFISFTFFIICASSLLISFMGYDIIESFSTSVSMLANIGPGMGASGIFTNFSEMPAAGKWFMSGLMLLGRLEILTVLVLFTRSFYRT